MGTASDAFYQSINEGWPKGMPLPDGPEAIAGAKRLWRHVMGRPLREKVKLTTGNRYTWIRRGVLSVNPRRPHGNVGGGWPSIVHLLSHLCHNRMAGRADPHDARQARIEKQMQAYVIAQGFHLGKLKWATVAKPPRDLVVERYARIIKRVATWEGKAKRATNALRKAQREQRQYEARHGERLA